MSAPDKDFDEALRIALANTYAFRAEYANESDFKYELFHQLSDLVFCREPLAQKVMRGETCRLHGEAKPQNGNPSKADLLVCDPQKRMPFNYVPIIVLELKKSLSRKDLDRELNKFKVYSPQPQKLYLISANETSLTHDYIQSWLNTVGEKCVVLTRNDFCSLPKNMSFLPCVKCDEVAIQQLIENCIEETLNLYGRGRAQFHGFFWCNYEHETNKGWTFPSEGDFNCQLYHRLRSRLSNLVEVFSEMHPANIDERLDFFLYCKSLDYSFAIEVKMNWDQFKPKFRNGVECRSEANTLLHKFAHCRENRHKNYLVLIQGQAAHKSNHRELAQKTLYRTNTSIFLFSYFEYEEKVVRTIIN